MVRRIEAHSHAKPVSACAEGAPLSRFILRIRGKMTPSFMDLALKAAETAGKSGEVPIGCVIVRGDEVIATAGNRTLTDRDPTAHAEILAIRKAAEITGSERLTDCDLYVTSNPAPCVRERFRLQESDDSISARPTPKAARWSPACVSLRKQPATTRLKSIR